MESDSKNSWSLLEKEVVNLDPKKLSLPPNLSLQKLPKTRITLYKHKVTPDYFKVCVEENSFLGEISFNLVGRENAMQAYIETRDGLINGNYILESQFHVKITLDSYRERFS